MADATERHGKTLFVRNLPYTTTNESLEKEFSDIGPLKSCFVVKDKDSGKCRGFGYVKFTLLDDAEKALTSVKKVEGRNVHIVFANKKEKKKRFGQPQKLEQETSGAVENQQNGDNDVDKKNARTTKPVLATVTKGRESDIGTAKSEKILPHSKQGKKEKKKIPVKGQKQAPNPLNEGKRARLIIRNLAFKCSKEELQQAFEKCGHVVDVHIPTKASGTRLGFGFVQFENKAQAGMAVAQLNGSSVAGRPVAVDWALPKNLYESRTPAKQTASGHEGSDSQEDMEVDGEKEKPKHSRSGGLPDINGRGAKSDRRDADDEDGEEGEEEEEEEEEEEDEDSDGDRVEEQMDDETDSGEAETSSDEDDHNHSDNRNHSGFGKDNKRGKHSTLMGMYLRHQ
ncbi:RNA-binding protein 28 [Plakobranchus ocellatus]|uniref:RNA-binding protein 28 n=1 Tax=Plakobranchus ocellatus TaxID=259542 RepID=A0AAV4DQK4_9GAST|nr:RNA-binding protein 28 [Plakobranchus ocellatus]